MVTGLESLTPEQRALLADPAKYRALRKAHRAEIKDAIGDEASQIMSEYVSQAKAVITEKLGKPIRKVLVKGDGSVKVYLQMRDPTGPRQPKPETKPVAKPETHRKAKSEKAKEAVPA